MPSEGVDSNIRTNTLQGSAGIKPRPNPHMRCGRQAKRKWLVWSMGRALSALLCVRGVLNHHKSKKILDILADVHVSVSRNVLSGCRIITGSSFDLLHQLRQSFPVPILFIAQVRPSGVWVATITFYPSWPLPSSQTTSA
jgi:hypothetical protein